ncbi:MAG: hypothetical protein ACJATI_000796 [Halioglobus sp.]|jgi:hypothetical protein
MEILQQLIDRRREVNLQLVKERLEEEVIAKQYTLEEKEILLLALEQRVEVDQIEALEQQQDQIREETQERSLATIDQEAVPQWDRQKDQIEALQQDPLQTDQISHLDQVHDLLQKDQAQKAVLQDQENHQEEEGNRF